jgi:hypothetical protein
MSAEEGEGEVIGIKRVEVEGPGKSVKEISAAL